MEIVPSVTEEDKLKLQYADHPPGYVPADVLFDAYDNMTHEQQKSYAKRFFHFRYGPTGMNDPEALHAAVQERHIQRIDQLLSRLAALICSQLDK